MDSYYNRPEATIEDVIDKDGKRWVKIGDTVTVDSTGHLDIVDLHNDVIKSGAEWISSIELENTIIEFDAVTAAAVIAVPDDRRQETGGLREPSV